MSASEHRASLERHQVLRVETDHFVIVVTSVEDYKGRGWGEPRAHVADRYGSGPVLITQGQIPLLARALEEAFKVFHEQFRTGRGG